MVCLFWNGWWNKFFLTGRYIVKIQPTQYGAQILKWCKRGSTIMCSIGLHPTRQANSIGSRVGARHIFIRLTSIVPIQSRGWLPLSHLICTLYTGCLNLLCPTSNQHFFGIRWHSKQKALIFGILSRGDLCLIHDLFFQILYSASTASDLQGVKIQVIYSQTASNLRLWDFKKALIVKFMHKPWNPVIY